MSRVDEVAEPYGAKVVPSDDCSTWNCTAPVPVYVQLNSTWAPTGVAIAGDELYVLEFDDAPPTRWRPRVRKLARDGNVSVLAEVRASQHGG